MFSVMWSEHCSYKSSREWLGRFPTDAPWVVVGPGENAGVVDLGDGWLAALRIESHNHPSSVEPYQGAATGVGGILRDIFTMGARPVAVWDPLRFGPLDDARNRYLLDGVVRGIAGYGNAVGVPTLGGEIELDDCYSANPLVNVMALGLLQRDQLVSSAASGEGNRAVLLGASTGRDGIGGASILASAGFDAGSGAKRPIGADRRSVRGEEADRGVPRAVRGEGWWQGSRTSGPPASRVPPPSRPPTAGWAWTSTSTPSTCVRRA